MSKRQSQMAKPDEKRAAPERLPEDFIAKIERQLREIVGTMRAQKRHTVADILETAQRHNRHQERLHLPVKHVEQFVRAELDKYAGPISDERYLFEVVPLLYKLLRQERDVLMAIFFIWRDLGAYGVNAFVTPLALLMLESGLSKNRVRPALQKAQRKTHFFELLPTKKGQPQRIRMTQRFIDLLNRLRGPQGYLDLIDAQAHRMRMIRSSLHLKDDTKESKDRRVVAAAIIKAAAVAFLQEMSADAR